MSVFRPYKFLVQPVVQEVDDGGNVLAEAQTNVVTIFGTDQLVTWAEEFEAKLSEAEIVTPPQG